MSSSGFATVLHLEPKPSPGLRRLLIPLHLLVAAGLILALPPIPALAGVAVLALLSWRERHGRRMPRCVARDADGGWWLDGAGPFMLQATTFVTPWLVVLHLRGTAGYCRLALLSDSLLPRQWRDLRVILRIEPGVG